MSPLSVWHKRIPSLAMLAVALLAVALRLYRLDNQSFAFDEGWTSYAINHTWAEMWGVLAPDNHPPAYYVLVKAFAEVAVYVDFPVRFVSVLCVVVLVSALYALGRRLGGPVAGLSAALVAACSPLLVYYAQEARMYSLLMALAVLSLYSLTRLAAEPRSTPWSVAYVLTTCGALYTHYFAVLLIATQGVVALVWLLRKWRAASAWKRWLLTQGAIALLYLPWLPTAIRQVRIGQGTWWRVPLSATVVLRDLWRFYILGPRRPSDVPVFGALLGGVALAVVAALLLGWRRGVGRWAFALAALFFPVAAIVWMGSVLPIYTDRYALVAAPGLPLVVGLGIASCWDVLGRRRAWLGCVAALVLLSAVLAGPLTHLAALYHEPAFWREDFRRAARYVMDTTGAGDTVIMIGSYQPLMQYYRGQATVVRFPAQGDSVQSEEAVVDALNQAIQPGTQVRLVMHSWPTVDPQGLVEGMLRAQCRLQGEHWQQETGQRPIRVMNFEDCARFGVEPRQPLNVVFGDQVALSAYRLIRFSPGQEGHVVLWWRTLRRPDLNYAAFVHLVGADGEIITQFDHLPLSDFYPLLAWPVGVDHRDSSPLKLRADVDLDGAWLAIGLYDRRSGVRLPVRVGDEPVGDYFRIVLGE
jgi:4-amino-4-deoxy-L-arabinose transferase-like glycosyltransferase